MFQWLLIEKMFNLIFIKSLVDIYVFQQKIIELYYAFFVLIQWIINKISMTKGNIKNNANNRTYSTYLLNCSLIW